MVNLKLEVTKYYWQLYGDKDVDDDDDYGGGDGGRGLESTPTH